MRLILKARTGLVAEKKWVTRGDKQYETTVYVKRDMDKKSGHKYKKIEGFGNIKIGGTVDIQEISTNREAKHSFTVTGIGSTKQFLGDKKGNRIISVQVKDNKTGKANTLHIKNKKDDKGRIYVSDQSGRIGFKLTGIK